MAVCLTVLVTAATVWVVAATLFTVPLLVYAVVVALLVTAILEPAVARLTGVGAYRWLAALLTELLLVLAVVGVGYLVVQRALHQLNDLQSTMNTALIDLHDVLVAPPFSLQEETATELQQMLIGYVSRLTPDPSAAARFVLELLTGAAIALFAAFFLLKDGPSMWGWAMGWTSSRRRSGAQQLGASVWATLTSYVRGLVAVAFIDAVAIGGALFALGVPLALSLSLIVFFGAFVPILGALLSGALAVLVTAVTVGPGQALVVLVVVVLVQQLESNVLAPLIMGRAVDLHPVVILLAVTAGGLVAGIGGAVIAVPLVAVGYVVARLTLRDSPRRSSVGKVPTGPQEGGSR